MTGRGEVPPPVPVRKNGSASVGHQEAPTLTRTREGEEERVFWSGAAVLDPSQLAKCSHPFRIPDHVYEYLLACTPETVAHIIGRDSVMTNRPSATKPDYYRVDFYSSSVVAADAILDRYNQLCGGVMDDLMTIRADDGAARAVHEMAKLFTCAIIKKSGWLKIVCKTDRISDVRQWLTTRTGRRLSDFPVMANDNSEADDAAAAATATASAAAAPKRSFLVYDRCRVEACLSDDIRTLGADVLVTSASPKLNSPLAVEAGPMVLVACHNHLSKRSCLSSGELFWSQAGRLSCKHLLHVVLPAQPGSPSSSKIVKKCLKKMDKLYKKILKNVDRTDVQHVAMPLFSEEMKNLDATMLMQCLTSALLSYKWPRQTKNHVLRLSLVSSCESNVNTLVNFLDKESERLKTKKKGNTRTLRRL